MGIFNRILAGNLYGSYGETARTIADTFRILSDNGNSVKSNEDVREIFLSIAKSRYTSALLGGFTKGNRLDKFDWEQSYTSYLRMNMQSEEQYYNLPTFAFVIMYYESMQKREELRDGKILADVLKVIFNETNKVFPKQTILSFEDYKKGILKTFSFFNMTSKIADDMEQYL